MKDYSNAFAEVYEIVWAYLSTRKNPQNAGRIQNEEKK